MYLVIIFEEPIVRVRGSLMDIPQAHNLELAIFFRFTDDRAQPKVHRRAGQQLVFALGHPKVIVGEVGKDRRDPTVG